MKNILLGLFLLISSCLHAQTDLLSTTGAPVATITNAATVTLTSGNIARNNATATIVHVEYVETSGTTAGTLSLFGSIDGVNFRSITSTTFTATDVASNGFIWIITGNPTPYVRVTWTGSGTMVATFKAKVLVKQ